MQSKSGVQAMRQEKKKRHLLGGYSHIDTDSLEVIQASEFVLESLRENVVARQKLSFELPDSNEGELQLKVLDAAKQVSSLRVSKVLIICGSNTSCQF